MPWEIKKINKKFQVMKQGSNEPVGDPHDTRKEAVDHMRALYASESKETLMKTIDGKSRPQSDFLVVEDPEKPSTWSLPVKVNGKPDHRLMGAAWAALTKNSRGNPYEGPDKGKALEKLKKMYEAEEIDTPSEKEFSVFKDKEGRYRWVTFSGSAFEDLDGEVIAEKAFMDDIDESDQTKEYGPLRWWHVPGLDIGDCDFRMMTNKILIESGTFRDERIGERLKESFTPFFASVGYLYPVIQRDENGIYHKIKIKERSLIPGDKGIASNLLTRLFLKEQKMNEKEKLAAFSELVGDETANEILKHAELAEKEAEKTGTRFSLKEFLGDLFGKKEPESQPDPAPEPIAEVQKQTEMEDEAEEKAEIIGNMKMDELKALIKEVVAEAVKPLMKNVVSEKKEKEVKDAAITEMQKMIKEHEGQVAALKEALAELTGEVPGAAREYRASADSSNIVDESKVKELGPKSDGLSLVAADLGLKI